MIHKTLKKASQTLSLLPFDSRILVAPRPKISRHLAACMSFIAGALNAGGFIVLGIYTSHVTGSLSRSMDDLALGIPSEAFAFAWLVTAFCLGAFSSGMVVSLGHRLRYRSRFAFNLSIEALLLCFFVLLAKNCPATGQKVPAVAYLLSFLMGMHNSVVTNISGAEVRTTHMTGIVTDIGLELSRLFNSVQDKHLRSELMGADRRKLWLYLTILASFAAGAITGALGFKHWGPNFATFFSVLLLLLAVDPLIFDLRVRFRLRRFASRLRA